VGIALFNPGPEHSTDDGLNEKSLVFRISLGKVHLLFTGDISAREEETLIASFPNLRSDVLFVPHHGSRSSSSTAFLQTLQPKVAVISCGPENVFSFPHQEVLERLRALGTTIYRTDLHGAVTVSTDGRTLRVKTFRRVN
jgi:competence protein ComEC